MRSDTSTSPTQAKPTIQNARHYRSQEPSPHHSCWCHPSEFVSRNTLHSWKPLLNNTDQNNDSKTEILDVAPIDVFAGLSKEFVHNFPLISPEMTKQALDVEFHWVTEHGQHGILTAGATVKPTVSGEICASYNYRMLIKVARLQIMPSVRRRSNGCPRSGVRLDSRGDGVRQEVQRRLQHIHVHLRGRPCRLAGRDSGRQDSHGSTLLDRTASQRPP
jgi:hypothetical protein